MNKILLKILVVAFVFSAYVSLVQAQPQLVTFTHMHNDTTVIGSDTVISLGLYPLLGGGLNGAAWFDYDYDGWLDFIVAGGGKPKLFRNIEGKRFIKVSKDSLTGPEEGVIIDTGVSGSNYLIAGYFNNDTLIDLVRSLYGTSGNGLVLDTNGGPEANFHFARKTDAFNFPFTSASFVGLGAGDIDMNGGLDLAWAGYCAKGPFYVLANDGNGVFTENTGGMVIGETPEMESWMAVFTDVNNDGNIDLFVGNMQRALAQPSRLYLGDGAQLTITDPNETGLYLDTAVIAGAWGDYDNDGYVDLWTTNFRDENGHPGYAYLFHNNGDGTFTDVKLAAGITDTPSTYYSSRGSDWADFNNDGWLDLWVGARNDSMQRLYLNNGDGTFTEVSLEANARVAPAYDGSRKNTCIDYDNDGWVDIFGHGQNLRCILLKNNGGPSNNWVQFIPMPAEGSTNRVLTSRITISVDNLPDQIRDIEGGTGNGSSGKIRAHFGLGSATKVNSVKVRWSNGVVEGPYTTDVAGDPILANRFYILREGVGLYRFEPKTGVSPVSGRVSGYALAQNYPNPFNPTTTIKFTLPTRSNVRLVVINVLGQVVKEVVNGIYDAGTHAIQFNASGLASGVYFYRLQAGDYTDVKKMVLLK